MSTTDPAKLIMSALDSLPTIRAATFWGECTAEAKPLAKAHLEAEKGLRETTPELLRAIRQSHTPSAMHESARRRLREAVATWSGHARELIAATRGWSLVDLSAIEEALDNLPVSSTPGAPRRAPRPMG